MNNISFKENHISQIPALQLLQKLGYTYISQEKALELRGGKTTNVLLEAVLRKQLQEINSKIQVSGTKTSFFSSQNIENGVVAMRNIAMDEGYISANETVYNLLTYGKALEQSVDGDKKSYNLQYIDWKHPERNIFHVTEEFAVCRAGTTNAYIPDIVLFVNGIPLVVIECKRPDIKDSLEQAISQHLRNQKEDGIRGLYMYSALLLSIATSFASYATTGTPEKFWAKWREQFSSKEEEVAHQSELYKLVNQPLKEEQYKKLFTSRYHYVEEHFREMGKAAISPTLQDEYLYCLCHPKRLLEIIFNFTLYDNGIKKVARYQQFFAVKKTMDRIRTIEKGKRKGGVIWHTQGSGKSLTMVMLAQAIVLDKSIQNPKIVLVTDRTDLDRQITGTFKKCGTYALNAKTGANLVELLESTTDAVITTVINKFETAVRRIKKPLESHNIFILIDEAHRSQYGEMAIKMEQTLPNACCIAMTGTPLMKKEKSTALKFGGMIRPVYTVDQAVKDGAVVPLLYEGRIVPQTVHENAIDNYFNMVCEPLTDYQQVDLKKKFSRAEQLNEAEQRIYAIAWDISRHFRDNWQGTKFKGQLVCPKKRVAIKYKEFLDEIGIVSTEVLITSPDDREGEDTAYGDTESMEKAFWKKMMDEHGTPRKYETNLINRFKNANSPEIMIVVDKLLTGFDEPKNTVMYLDKNLRNHTLLQAVARVNRVCDDKEFGYIIDYYGVLSKLNDAFDLYADYDSEEIADIQQTMIDIKEEIAQLPQLYSDLWSIFKEIPNKRDLEAYSQLLRYEDKRQNFYEKLTAFASCLKIALSSAAFHKETSEADICKYKDDLTLFLKLRSAVQERYSDAINYKQFEGQIQKLINTHIESGEVKTITELVNVFDKEKFEAEVEKITGKAAKADTIASRTTKYINEKMETDPAFYKKFSEMLKETIADYEQGRIDEAEYLKRVMKHKEEVLAHTDNEIPQKLIDNNVGKAFFGLSLEVYKSIQLEANKTVDWKQVALETSLAFDTIIKPRVIIDWQTNLTLIGQIKIELEDFLIDEVKRKYDLQLTFEDMDTIIDKCVDVAKLWYK
ncbi:HsdR family type I site-specific deoxyribonuclease [uncultured Bacteroides sp.]|uniref:type I restriction endonuclease subunit R n=1 Tax=uncultured Bacteroides sp. TaxID=162156 RepID=UPI002AAB912C|nr:HsdR family type I site-specific deoxyribonuclease [uncultured Bacteroides sp.]